MLSSRGEEGQTSDGEEGRFLLPFRRGFSSGKVDGLDLTALASSWDASGAQWVDGDLTGDGNVDGLDLTALAGNWDAVANGPIPEPATLALLSLGGAALLRRRRRS